MEDKMEKIVSLAKRRGFVFQGSEIYGGLAGTWDYGPRGVQLKENIKKIWWKLFVDDHEDVYGIDAAILMNPKVWEAAGHIANFTDPLVECMDCRKRFKASSLKNGKSKRGHCPECDGVLSEAKQFNMMLKTNVGAVEDSSTETYLRPETAQGIFTNFKNVIDSMQPKLPFGIAQIGKAFRNEITPRDFIFRVRELEQMEVEYFVKSTEWESAFEKWKKIMWNYIDAIGISRKHVHELEISEEDRAHYSSRTIDFEYEYPFGRNELYGLAYRTDYDLKKHMEASGVNLTYKGEGEEPFIPHVIEPSLGIERTVLAVLLDAYREDKIDGEQRVYLALKPEVAPIKVAVFPLLKNKLELVSKAKEVYVQIKKAIPQIMFDDNGNIGKRYRRQDEIGTPYCVTIDFDTLTDNTVTVRNRDTAEQKRVPIEELKNYLSL